LIKIIDSKIKLSELEEMASSRFGNLVKAVVDIEKEIMAIDGELHADEEALLLENGSSQVNLWGINIYPGLPSDERVEFDSIINLRPGDGNSIRGVENEIIRKKILLIINKMVLE
jgi:hypothetical protein